MLSTSNFIPYSGVTPQGSAPAVLGQTVTSPFPNNRIPGQTYDGAGNLQSNSTVTTAATTSYGAENRVQSVTGLPMGAVQNYYDGDSRRVMKVVCPNSSCTVTAPGAQITTYVYDAFGQLAAEYGSSSPVSGTQYLFTDHLGSTRAMLSSTGAFSRCYDCAPFGEELPSSVGSRANCYTDIAYPSATPGALSTKFTSKERDAETGLDFFEARYYSSAQGRFTSPDEFKGGFLDAFSGQSAFQPGPLPYADITAPQTFNKYAYVRHPDQEWMERVGHSATQDTWGYFVGFAR